MGTARSRAASAASAACLSDVDGYKPLDLRFGACDVDDDDQAVHCPPQKITDEVIARRYKEYQAEQEKVSVPSVPQRGKQQWAVRRDANEGKGLGNIAFQYINLGLEPSNLPWCEHHRSMGGK